MIPPCLDKVICVGKNYAAHARELGDLVPDQPVLFLKPPSSIVQYRGTPIRVSVPSGMGALHHELEVVLSLNARGESVAFTLGLDMTLRDLQSQLKKAGHPWEVSKVFAGAALLGEWRPISELPQVLAEPFELQINGVRRQQGRVEAMIFSIEQCIAHAANYFELRDGDLLFTGTPEGVGPVVGGDCATALWGARKLLEVEWG